MAGAAGVLGLVLSFVLPPTVSECKIFTACHEIEPGVQLVSWFSSDANAALQREEIVLQIAHSTLLTAAFALFGFAVGAVLPQHQGPPAQASKPPAPQDYYSPPPPAATRAAPRALQTIELEGIGAFAEYYLKIDSDELAGMGSGLIIGRDEIGSTFAILDDTVSRTHARLAIANGTFAVEDAGSTNGTRVNGRALRPHEFRSLNSGDRVAFGTAGFTVRIA